MARDRRSQPSDVDLQWVPVPMPMPMPVPLILILLLLVVEYLGSSHADVGNAAQYGPPYLPSACYGEDPSQFPTSNLFAAAGDGIWDNGASCGRQYLVRCISAKVASDCDRRQTIQVMIVDYALALASRPSSEATTIVLSSYAFGIIANSSAAEVNVEFQQV